MAGKILELRTNTYFEKNGNALGKIPNGNVSFHEHWEVYATFLILNSNIYLLSRRYQCISSTWQRSSFCTWAIHDLETLDDSIEVSDTKGRNRRVTL